MNENCYSCGQQVDTETATAVHVRGSDGEYVQSVYVCASEYECYDRAAESIDRDDERIGRAPTVAETGTRPRL